MFVFAKSLADISCKRWLTEARWQSNSNNKVPFQSSCFVEVPPDRVIGGIILTVSHQGHNRLARTLPVNTITWMSMSHNNTWGTSTCLLPAWSWCSINSAALYSPCCSAWPVRFESHPECRLQTTNTCCSVLGPPSPYVRHEPPAQESCPDFIAWAHPLPRRMELE